MAVTLFKASDTVLEARHARWCPGTSVRLGVTEIRPELWGSVGLLVIGAGSEVRSERGQRGDVGDRPGFGSVGKVGVRQNYDWRAVRNGNPGRLDSDVEAVTGRDRRNDWNRRFAVATVHRRQQVRLLHLGRNTGGGTGTLNVDNNQGQFERNGQTHGLALKVKSGTTRRGDTQGTAVRCAEGRGHTGNLIFRLEGANTKFLALGQLVQDVRCGSNGV